mmetsp:Transcript_16729/g.32522  ORF Transcript_16729/g.32522 Transcript_16729/m.32522 type:complete len:373 (+) Transcript_16729:183-1301(+)|eukprot:CAMPEP_0171549202 /NCGR_PEP_ID=MMETSP0960-20121227/6299_1 /TAXON_ID=87120 /ORGANISM="Aurantiochytrium limacinum, Strain ATCCMYA-1381" /LENGTH=372 /DNA_ID=CAMNT_0012097843 /DNA_START=175 /DNA_END=1293 /DNA_ORIENTATION=+
MQHNDQEILNTIAAQTPSNQISSLSHQQPARTQSLDLEDQPTEVTDLASREALLLSSADHQNFDLQKSSDQDSLLHQNRAQSLEFASLVQNYDYQTKQTNGESSYFCSDQYTSQANQEASVQQPINTDLSSEQDSHSFPAEVSNVPTNQNSLPEVLSRANNSHNIDSTAPTGARRLGGEYKPKATITSLQFNFDESAGRVKNTNQPNPSLPLPQRMFVPENALAQNPLPVFPSPFDQRLATEARQHPLSSKYRGVYWNKNCKAWRARIWVNGKSEHLGNFDDEFEAARAFDKRALDLGRNGTMNFPMESVSSQFLSRRKDHRRISCENSSSSRQSTELQNHQRSLLNTPEEQEQSDLSHTLQQDFLINENLV